MLVKHPTLIKTVVETKMDLLSQFKNNNASFDMTFNVRDVFSILSSNETSYTIYKFFTLKILYTYNIANRVYFFNVHIFLLFLCMYPFNTFWRCHKKRYLHFINNIILLLYTQF